MATDPLYGWDLTFKTVERDIRRKSDVLIAFVHWNLTKQGFRSIGIGDERSLSGDENKSELLPTGWNDSENYTVRYVLDNTLYILHGLNTDGNLIINLMRSEDLAVSNIAFNIDDTVKDLSGSVDEMLPSNKEIIHNIRRDLIDTMINTTTVAVQTQTRSDVNYRFVDDPLRVPPRAPPGFNPDSPDLCQAMSRAYYSSGYYIQPNLTSRAYAPLGYSISISLPRSRDLPTAGRPNVGRSDVDPFAPMGGGMIFNPFAPRRDVENPGLGVPGGLPRGAVPPGARFDPFAPPAPGGVGPLPARRQPPPDADHLPPPGFNDHMFM